MVISRASVRLTYRVSVKVAIRTDASSDIGSGHLMRCLVLATGLKNSGANVQFICSGQDSKWIEHVRERDFDCKVLYPSNKFGDADSQNDSDSSSSESGEFGFDWQQDLTATKNVLDNRKLDWLIVDHYGIDWRWEKALRSYTRRIMVIDDLADRNHECDIVLDSVFGRRPEDYQYLVPNGCRILLGTNYALLRSEFNDCRNFALNRRNTNLTVRNILVSLGGVDQANLTGKVLNQLKRFEWNSDFRIDVIAGKGFMHQSEIEQQLASIQVETTLEIDVNDMANRIANADLGIGAFGVSTWERFCLGLPSVNIVTQENQRHASAGLKQQEFSGIMFAHSIESELVKFVNQLVSDNKLYRKFALWCSQSVDGKGLTRVIKEIAEIK